MFFLSLMIYERDSNNYLYQNWLTVKESDQYVPLDRRNHKKVCQGAKPLVWRVFYDWVVPEEESLPYIPVCMYFVVWYIRK